MEPIGWLVLGGLAVGVLAVLAWRPYRGRRRTAEEALESEALQREQDRVITDATYLADRYNVPGRRR